MKMYFCDLDKLKLFTSYNCKHVGRDVNFPADVNEMSITEIQRTLAQVFDDMFSSENFWKMETNIELYLHNCTTIELATFESIINVALMEFTTHNTLYDRGRKREYRLGIPDKLKGMHINHSLLKEMINHQTKVNCFNLIISYNDVVFDLCQPETFKDESQD